MPLTAGVMLSLVGVRPGEHLPPARHGPRP
jgi:hypothetical protein